ncbi:MAG: NADP-dependent oxidoreductase [Bacteroidales bacterium]|nr:NADP-dependent oxidoreductase [Bacteroidales bacterium]
MNRAILLAKRPKGKPLLSDFKFVREAMPVIRAGEVMLKTGFVSVDPYLRGRMNDAKSYVAPFELDKAIRSGVIAQVIESKHPGFIEGDYVSGMLEWKEYLASDGQGLHKVDADKAPLSAYLGVLGMTGLTAYLGLSEIGKPKKGETVVVSGAAGAVGSVAGQIAKIRGCRVVGIAGSDEKAGMLTSEFGFDAAINYRSTRNMRKAIATACPDGVDVYFDNVGGEISDAVLVKINRFARIVVCGAISVYNASSLPQSISVQPFLVRNSALMQGFIVNDYEAGFPGALVQLSGWLTEGKLRHAETLVEGFDLIPQAFLDLFEGRNKGKMVVKI